MSLPLTLPLPLPLPLILTLTLALTLTQVLAPRVWLKHTVRLVDPEAAAPGGETRTRYSVRVVPLGAPPSSLSPSQAVPVQLGLWMVNLATLTLTPTLSPTQP